MDKELNKEVDKEVDKNADADKDMICCENLVKIYKTGDMEVMALQGLDLTVKQGEMLAVIGNSGSGKSTFLNMVGGLAKPSAGRLLVDGKDLFKMKEKELVEYKQKTVGFVWQNNARNLFPYLSALENVNMPMMLRKGKEKNPDKRALMLLDMVGMKDKADRKLHQLSGGEQQRVAIAIALANEPKILLADEPTGSVDVATAAQILDVFRRLNEELGLTIVIVTHDLALAGKVSRVVRIRDGKISSEQLVKTSYADKLKEIGSLEDIQDTHEEFAIIDRNNRIQLPAEYVEELGIKNGYVKVTMEDGKIILASPNSF